MRAGGLEGRREALERGRYQEHARMRRKRGGRGLGRASFQGSLSYAPMGKVDGVRLVLRETQSCPLTC